jgi:hypothetical protein
MDLFAPSATETNNNSINDNSNDSKKNNNRQLFVLLGPHAMEQGEKFGIPDILCVIDIAYEFTSNNIICKDDDDKDQIELKDKTVNDNSDLLLT